MKTVKMRCVMSNSSSFTVGEIVDTSGIDGSHLINVPSKGFATFSGWVTDTGVEVHGVGRIIASFRRKNIKTDRKMIVRAMVLIARNYGWKDSDVKRQGLYSSVKEWARAWADQYINKSGEFEHDLSDHDFPGEVSRGDAFYEFMLAEVEAA